MCKRALTFNMVINNIFSAFLLLLPQKIKSELIDRCNFFPSSHIHFYTIHWNRAGGPKKPKNKLGENQHIGTKAPR